MKLEPAIRLDKRNKITSKKSGDNVISASCGIIVIFLVMANFEQSENSHFN